MIRIHGDKDISVEVYVTIEQKEQALSLLRDLLLIAEARNEDTIWLSKWVDQVRALRTGYPASKRP